jgi:hypothetical protein
MSITHPNKTHNSSLTRNERVMLWICKVLGNPITFYVFCGLALISLPGVIEQHSVPVFVSWLSQTLIQLTALAALQCASNLLGRRAQTDADHQYEVNMMTLRGISKLLKQAGLPPIDVE